MAHKLVFKDLFTSDEDFIENYDLKNLEVYEKGQKTVVYIVYDKVQKKKVALKIYQNVGEAEKDGHMRDIKSRFKLRHNNIIQVLNFNIKIETDSMYSILVEMEYPNLTSLHQYLEKNKKLTDKEIEQCFMDILSAIIYLQLQGVYNNDVKPKNIFIKTDQLSGAKTFLLGDFDIAITWKYSSLEQVEFFTGLQIEHFQKSEPYQLGLVLLRCGGATEKEIEDIYKIILRIIKGKSSQDEGMIEEYTKIFNNFIHKLLDKYYSKFSNPKLRILLKHMLILQLDQRISVKRLKQESHIQGGSEQMSWALSVTKSNEIKYGQLIYDNGDKYEGLIKGKQKYQYGKMTYKNGDIYVGEISQDGQVNGFGTITFTNSKTLNYFIGNFQNGVPNGFGQLFFINGERYWGNVVYQSRDTFGINFTDKGERIGQWDNDQQDGQLYFIRKKDQKVIQEQWNQNKLEEEEILE